MTPTPTGQLPKKEFRIDLGVVSSAAFPGSEVG